MPLMNELRKGFATRRKERALLSHSELIRAQGQCHVQREQKAKVLIANAPGRTDLTSGGDPVGTEGLRQRTGRTESGPGTLTRIRSMSCFAFCWLGSVASNILAVPEIRHSVSFVVLRPVEAQGGLAHAHIPRSNYNHLCGERNGLSLRGDT
jgi:hypothetical protein